MKYYLHVEGLGHEMTLVIDVDRYEFIIRFVYSLIIVNYLLIN